MFLARVRRFLYVSWRMFIYWECGWYVIDVFTKDDEVLFLAAVYHGELVSLAAFQSVQEFMDQAKYVKFFWTCKE